MPGVVLDASVAIALVLIDPLTDAAQTRFGAWRQDHEALYAPALWAYEISSIVHRAVASARIRAQDCEPTMSRVWELGVELVSPTNELQLATIRWAQLLGQPAAYDATYLAVAQELGCPLWTGDRRLAQAAVRAGAPWVHLLQ